MNRETGTSKLNYANFMVNARVSFNCLENVIVARVEMINNYGNEIVIHFSKPVGEIDEDIVDFFEYIVSGS